MNTLIRETLALFTAAVLVLIVVPETAHAYGGPGSVVSAIGTLLAVLAAVFAAVFGFLWFPLKRFYKKMTATEETESVAGSVNAEASVE